MNVKIGPRVGRVHITEVVDSLSQEVDPFKVLQKNMFSQGALGRN